MSDIVSLAYGCNPKRTSNTEMTTDTAAPATAQALLEMRAFGKDYAKQVVRNAQALGRELDKRERYIVEHRLLVDEGETLAEIGKELGISRERVRQIEVQAIKKLRQIALRRRLREMLGK
mgnify:CR=1 FL=1